MDQDTIIQYVTDTFTGLDIMRPTDGPGAGDTFFFYDPQHNIAPTRRLPFATIVINATEISSDAARHGAGACVGCDLKPANGVWRSWCSSLT